MNSKMKSPSVARLQGFSGDTDARGNGATKFRSDIEDAHAELALRGEAVGSFDDIPSFLDRRGEVCDDGIKVRLHERCQYPWIDACEASKGSSL